MIEIAYGNQSESHPDFQDINVRIGNWEFKVAEFWGRGVLCDEWADPGDAWVAFNMTEVADWIEVEVIPELYAILRDDSGCQDDFSDEL